MQNNSPRSAHLLNIQWSTRKDDASYSAVYASQLPPTPLSQQHSGNGLEVIERCMSCGIKGEASVIRAAGPHHGRMCPHFMWRARLADDPATHVMMH